VDCTLKAITPKADILDAGAETYSRVLPWFWMYGCRRLQAINIAFDKKVRRGPHLPAW
jgi:hypothetical protein